MTNYITAVGATPTLAIPENLENDPVTKAVYDNILGKLPTRKPKVSVFCKTCKLEFSSQVVLETHLAGSKHQRKIQSQDLMKNLSDTEEGFERNPATGVIRCTLCDVTVNSPQLLAAHVAGNKHQSKKGKRENGDDGGTPAKKLCSGEGETNGEGGGTADAEGGEPKAKPKKKERAPLDMEIPSYVTKVEENKTGGRFLCNPCKAHCNSDIQLQQHLASKKHEDKLSGKKKIPPTTGGSFGRTRKTGGGGYFGGGRGRGAGSSYFRNYSNFASGASSASGAPSSSSWNSFSSSSGAGLFSAASAGSYGQSYADPNFSSASGYSDSYGLSSLGRGTSSAADYSSYDRPSSSSAAAAVSRSSAGVGRGSSLTYGRTAAAAAAAAYSTDPYGRATAVSTDPYGRVTSPPYGHRSDLYERVEYATAEYPAVAARPDDHLSSYGRAAVAAAAAAGPEYTTDYAHGHYGASAGQSLAAAGRSVPFTYAAPLSHNFVSGGSIL